ncbi:Glycosyltransferase involved in cell wall bisynthesis [Micromonospora purpureochromogenes]|uniref:Glycosyltransferase involved in cell wall bisynthesis n=1 Tax=Micromonospora purpureochromogenes TaxID=47872 RepID=A0A1C5A6K3_9ACTN|nr:glycosyltransferase [Micromonospora purpureochromogenes]SCF40799.1 Glycosyltransferase involved in cell wall bisynthesis [Micromonospora purpureochromogenes]
MRLHFVLPQLEPLYGMERAAVLLMRGLRAHGVAVSATVLSRAIPPGLDDLDIDHLGVGTRITRLVEAVAPLRRRIRALPPDVEVVSSGLWGTVPVGAALAGSGRSFLAWEHSLLPERLRIDRRVRTLARMTRIGALRPRLVIAVSEGVARTVRQLTPGQPVVTITNPVPLAGFVPPREVAERTRIGLLTTAAFRPYKNHGCALSALAALPENYHLTLAGDGEERQMLENRAHELGLGHRTTFLGRVPGVAGLLAEADLLVHPSRAETFGFSLVEAAEAGLPVATLPMPAMDELIPNLVPGTLATEPTPEGLADAILRMTGDERPTRADFEKAWRARCAALDPAEVSRRWVEALTR